MSFPTGKGLPLEFQQTLQRNHNTNPVSQIDRNKSNKSNKMYNISLIEYVFFAIGALFKNHILIYITTKVTADLHLINRDVTIHINSCII